jgi:thioredoxin 1
MSKVREITDSQFESEVIQADKPVLAYFWAPWCGPCRLMSPSLNSLAESYGDRLKIVKLEVDPNPETVTRYQVKGVPALRLFKDQKVVSSSEGAMGKDKIKAMLDQYL